MLNLQLPDAGEVIPYANASFEQFYEDLFEKYCHIYKYQVEQGKIPLDGDMEQRLQQHDFKNR